MLVVPGDAVAAAEELATEIVVPGDAVAAAEELATEIGGTVHVTTPDGVADLL
ncbi:hypothetical protein [Halohasta salina]|uniref:hypothetical protein n=1 Tax=Halohasta salina TaxID=2961621 RepID=UPI0020A44707|nr:hypothetical protein [Halohasta salina]